MKPSDFLIGFASALTLGGAVFASYAVLTDAPPGAASPQPSVTASAAPAAQIDKRTIAEDDSATASDGDCADEDLVYDRVGMPGWRCMPRKLARTGAAITRAALSPEQARANREAEIVANRMEAQLRMTEAAQRACGGRWRYGGTENFKAFTLDINQVGYVLRQDQGSVVIGSAESTDGETMALVANDETYDPITGDHVLRCRGNDALLSGDGESGPRNLVKM